MLVPPLGCPRSGEFSITSCGLGGCLLPSSARSQSPRPALKAGAGVRGAFLERCRHFPRCDGGIAFGQACLGVLPQSGLVQVPPSVGLFPPGRAQDAQVPSVPSPTSLLGNRGRPLPGGKQVVQDLRTALSELWSFPCAAGVSATTPGWNWVNPGQRIAWKKQFRPVPGCS